MIQSSSVPLLGHGDGAKIDIGLVYIGEGTVIVGADIQLSGDLIRLAFIKALSYQVDIRVAFFIELRQLIVFSCLTQITSFYIFGQAFLCITCCIREGIAGFVIGAVGRTGQMGRVDLCDRSCTHKIIDLFICLTLQIVNGCFCRAIEGDQRVRQIICSIALQTCPYLLTLDIHGAADGVGKDLVGGVAFFQTLGFRLALIGSQHRLAIVGHVLLKYIDIDIAVLIVHRQIIYRDLPVVTGLGFRSYGIEILCFLCPYRILVVRVFLIGCKFFYRLIRILFLLVF